MAKFVDKSGVEWELSLNVGMIEDIKDKLNVDLDELISKPEQMAEVVFSTPRKVVELMYACCESEIERRGLTPKQFATLFDRDVIDRANDAFIEAIMTFYPRASVGGVVREKLPNLLKAMDQKLATTAEKKFQEVLSSIVTS